MKRRRFPCADANDPPPVRRRSALPRPRRWALPVERLGTRYHGAAARGRSQNNRRTAKMPFGDDDVRRALLRRIARWRVHAPQDPGQPVDAELEFVASIVVGAGIGRNVLPFCADWLLGLSVNSHHDGTIRTVFRPDPHLAVGAVGHDGEISGVVIPPVEQIVAADRYGLIDRHRFGHLTLVAGCIGTVLWGGAV